VNRFLLDKMAEAGRGEVEYVGLNDDGSAAAKRFHERIRNPLLTDISVEWNGLPVTDVYPQRIPDLFSAKPVVLSGRYMRGASGSLRLRGHMAGKAFTREIPVKLATNVPQHDALASLWARTRIDALTQQDYTGARQDIRDQITLLGLDYRLMTQYTSFVAVEETTITDGGKPRTVQVPVEMPDGVSYEGVFGTPGDVQDARMAKGQIMMRGRGMGSGGGFFGPGRPMSAAAPQSPQPSRPAQMEAVADMAAARKDKAEELKPASKLHPALAALAARTKSGTRLAGDDKLLKNGKVEVQVYLLDNSPDALVKLKAVGLEIIAQPRGAKTVLGRIAPKQLEALAALGIVRYVAPAQ
jgi:Ca-activated chloride channel homolog